MNETSYSPDPTRVSVLMATILLAFGLTRVLNGPVYPMDLNLGGLDLSFTLNLNTIIVLLAAALTASGMDWLLRTHPSLQPGETREHWLLPTLTVLVIGVALSTLPPTPVWWLGFALGAAILLMVFVAEYVVVEPHDLRYPIASSLLNVLAFVIFLILAVALKAASSRLIILVPALFLGSGLASLRSLHLRLNERWEPAWAIGIGIVVIQLGSGLHYLPLTPVRYGLLLLGPAYALTGLAAGLLERTPLRRALVEPMVMLVLFWGFSIWFH